MRTHGSVPSVRKFARSLAKLGCFVSFCFYLYLFSFGYFSDLSSTLISTRLSSMVNILASGHPILIVVVSSLLIIVNL